MRYNDLAEVGILGVLNERGPETLEAVRDRLQHAFKKYWGFSSGVITPTARELEEEGYIVSSIREEGDRYLYRITEEGRERLRDLVRDGFRDDDIFDLSKRHHAMIRLGFLHHLPEEEQAAILNIIEEKLSAERDRWLEVADAHDAEREDGVTGYRQDLVDLNIRMLETFVEWIHGLQVRTLDREGT